MILENPLGLISLVGIPIIIALHLLRERRKRIPVSSINLWSFLQIEVHGSRPKRIPLTLLLVCDLVIMTLIGLAISHPRIPRFIPSPEAHHLVIIMDISSSMLSTDVIPDRFTQAKTMAGGLLASVAPDDVITLLTFGKYPHWIGDTREISYSDLLSRFSEIKPGEIGHDLESALSMGAATISDLPVEFHVFTDTAFPEPDLEKFPFPIQLHKFGNPTSNQAVLDISLRKVENGMNTTQVFTQFVNFGSGNVRRLATLLVDGEVADSVEMILPARKIVSQVWENIPGEHTNFGVKLIGTDALADDDTAWIGNSPLYNPRVLLVSDSKGPLEQALRAVVGYSFGTISPQSYSVMSSADVTIFQNFLPETWPDGITMVVDPPAGSRLLQIGDQIELTAATQILKLDSILDDTDFTNVRWYKVWKVKEMPSGFETLVKGGDQAVLLKGAVGLKRVFVLLSDLNSGNLTKLPSFPIMIANLVKIARGLPIPDKIVTGEPIILPNGEMFQKLSITSPLGDTSDLSYPWSLSFDQTISPGLYQFRLTDTSGQVSEYFIGVNRGDTEESDLNLEGWTYENKLISNKSVEALDSTMDLTPWLLGLSILLMLIEARIAWR